MTPVSITVIGPGAWGTALAMLLARNGHTTMLWGRKEDGIFEMAKDRVNERFFPEQMFPESLIIEPDLEKAIQQSDCVLLTVPSAVFVTVLKIIDPMLNPGTPIIWGTKGLDSSTGRFFHDLASEVLTGEHALGVISGPSFAKEVANGMPTAVSAASIDEDLLLLMKNLFENENFKLELSNDMVGIQVCGVIKNVMAIATGMVDGLGFGTNTQSALMTFGLQEARKLGEVFGADPASFLSLAAVGDLVLTCTDNQSRNRRFGLLFAHGKSLDEAAKEIGHVVEGVHNVRTVMELAKKHGLKLPITEMVEKIIDGERPAIDIVKALFETA